jgi:hypothetical protein
MKRSKLDYDAYGRWERHEADRRFAEEEILEALSNDTYTLPPAPQGPTKPVYRTP